MYGGRKINSWIVTALGKYTKPVNVIGELHFHKKKIPFLSKE
jgi:hypothetical protein